MRLNTDKRISPPVDAIRGCLTRTHTLRPHTHGHPERRPGRTKSRRMCSLRFNAIHKSEKDMCGYDGDGPTDGHCVSYHRPPRENQAETSGGARQSRSEKKGGTKTQTVIRHRRRRRRKRKRTRTTIKVGNPNPMIEQKRNGGIPRRKKR